MKSQYDLFVIGAGSGGVRGANAAAGYGARVGLAESTDVGGTCVNRGCVPKKLLVVASRFPADSRHAHCYGWSVDTAPKLDWPLLRDAVERQRLRISGVQREHVEQAGVELRHGHAKLLDAHTVRIGSETITAERVLIATGARARLAGVFPGAEHCLGSDDMFRLPALPQHLLVIGAGYIGCEFASMFAGFRCRVTLLARDGEILPGFDREIARHLRETLSSCGLDIRLDVKVERVERNGEWKCVHLANGETIEADMVLAAIGRTPNVEGLGLEAAGVRQGRRGEIAVDAASRTSVDSIYAVGDVTDRVALTPVAIREAQAFADSVYGGKPHGFDHHLIPTAVFTTPEVVAVGLTEDGAAKTGRKVRIFRSRFRPLRQVMTTDSGKVLIKLVVDAGDDRVIGAHAVGSEASEWVQFLDVIVRSGLTKAQFEASLPVHPTVAEEFVTLRT